MPDITLSIPESIYKKMKKHSGVKWSEVVRKAIVEYLEKLEESRTEISTKELLNELDSEFKKSLNELDFEKAVKGYERMSDAEWKRISTTRVN